MRKKLFELHGYEMPEAFRPAESGHMDNVTADLRPPPYADTPREPLTDLPTQEDGHMDHVTARERATIIRALQFFVASGRMPVRAPEHIADARTLLTRFAPDAVPDADLLTAIKDLLNRAEQAEAQVQALTAEIAQVTRWVLALKQGTCWCGVGVGVPYLSKHSPACDEIRAYFHDHQFS